MGANRFATTLSAIAVAVWLQLASVTSLASAAEPARRTTYGQARDFLVKYTKVVEMTNEDGGRVAICPEYQGRIMTSTCGGLEGPSFGWINKAFIEKSEKGASDPHFNNYGGEDRFWLAPEGGQFSLWFAPGAEQNLENWHTPPALNDGPFQLADSQDDPFYRLSRRLQLQNASRTRFDLDVTREIHMLAPFHFGKLFGPEAQSALTAGHLKIVGFQSINTVVNRGAPLSKDKGLVAIWILGMFPPGAQTQIIAPYKPGDDSALGPVVKSDYFGETPADRLKVTPASVRFIGDGQYRSKIGISQRRGKPVAGSIDLENGVLTLIHFSMPDDPAAHSYVNNAWQVPQNEPYVGDVFNSYNDGPPAPGKPALGGFYELESVSPAAQLPTGKSMTHVHSTFHIQGEVGSLKKLARIALEPR